MNIVSNLQEKADQYRPTRQTPEAAGEAFDALLDAAIAGLPDKVGLEPHFLATRNATEESIKMIRKHRESLYKLGDYGLAAVMAKMSTGDFDEATTYYIRNTLTLDELLALSHAADDGALEAKANLDAMRQEVLNTLVSLGSLTARYALPALLSVLRA